MCYRCYVVVKVKVKVKVDDVLVLRFVVVGVLIGSVGVLSGANQSQR